MARKKNKKTTKGRTASKSNTVRLKDSLRSLFSHHPSEAFSYQEIIKRLKLRSAKEKSELKDLLFSMESNEKIRRNRQGRWVSSVAPSDYVGKLDHVNPNFGYVMIDELEEDVWVKTEDLKFAVDGDKVKVRITKPPYHGKKAEGKVTEVIERNKTEFVGRIEISEKFSFVIPDNRNIHFDIFVYPEKTKDAKNNDKVLVDIKTWHNAKNRSPVGEVTQVLGPAGENEAEIHSIMAEFGLPFQFPKSVEQAADHIPVEIPDEEYKTRKDFRQITTFTIDPEDAKDFDDALSYRKLDNGHLEVGIHIADVAHYVLPDSTLDQEAQERATSVYLVDRTIPMLPEKLSNGLCSLRPNEEKLAFSAVFEIDDSGKVYHRWFGRTVIESDRRFSYEEAQERIENADGDFQEEINHLNEIAKRIRDYRFKSGAVNFETVEVRFKLDDKGKPLAVVPKERKDAHKMIEEYMLLANREVATFIFNKKDGGKSQGESTFVYRIHDDPDPEKLDVFAKFAGRFGHELKTSGEISKSLNRLMDDIQGKPEQNVLEQIAIRSMAKARYTTEPKGHFGLAFDHYTHFTSPIRRYPDVMVHRLLAHYLDKGKSPDSEPIEKQCIHSSEREKRAADAERASIKYKQVEFMSAMLGETFVGIVSGVTEWGVYVEIIETKCEGMIRVSDLEDDYYEYDEKNFRIIGKKNKNIIALGDQLNVQVVRTDIDRRTIDLILSDEQD